MQLHDILLLRTSAILPEAISAGGLTTTTDTSLFLTTYRGVVISHLIYYTSFFSRRATVSGIDFGWNLTYDIRWV